MWSVTISAILVLFDQGMLSFYFTFHIWLFCNFYEWVLNFERKIYVLSFGMLERRIFSVEISIVLDTFSKSVN